MNCTLVKLTLLVAFEGGEDEINPSALEALGDSLAEMVRQDDRALTVAAEYDSVEQDIPMDTVDDDLAAALDQQWPSAPRDTGFDRLIAKLSLEGVNGIAPLLPDPAYSQDVALVAFLIDQLRAKVNAGGLEDNPRLYDVARDTCHAHGLPWTDPRTGVTFEPPRAPVHVNVHGQTFTDEDLKRAGQDWGDGGTTPLTDAQVDAFLGTEMPHDPERRARIRAIYDAKGGSPNEWAVDRCRVCGKFLGSGWRIMHVGICESCRDAPTS